MIFAYDPDKDETTGSHNRGYQGAVISCPQFQDGDTYQAYIGGDVEGTETDGLYDVSTVTGFSGGVLQQYTGTDVGMGFGHPGGGQEFPEGGEFPGGDREPPEGGEFPGGDREPPEGGEFPGSDREPPEGGEFSGSDREIPEGMDRRPVGDGQRPEGEPGRLPEGFDPDSGGGEPSTQFHMTDKVNAFSGVTDAVDSAAD